MSEFSYRGDAGFRRPDPAAPDAARLFFEETYLRLNPAGVHQELWYHVFGCRSWLTVTRNTRTHEILAVACGGGAADTGAGRS